MRKFLLILMLAPLGLFAQSANDVAPSHHNYGLIGGEDKTPVKVPASLMMAKDQIPGNPEYFIVSSTDTFTMGVTVYDLQTNGAVAHRLVVYPGGEISGFWTTSPLLNDKLFTTRGTGYNHFDGTAWSSPAGLVTQPVEKTNYHSGWPNPCLDSTGGAAHEFCISHSPGGVITGISTSTIQRVDNNKIGGSSWTQKTVSDPTTNSPIWPRVAQSGKYAYMVANYSPLPGDTVEIKGIKDPTVYYRSTDGGATWKADSTLPGYDTSGDIAYSSLYGNSDAYAIDAQDSTVVIVIGSYFQDVSMWKSTDYGKTFTKTIVDTFQYRHNHGHGISSYIKDTAIHFTNDGSVDVILDKSDNAHIFYGTRGIKDSGGTHNDSFYIRYEGYNGIMHWDEKNRVKTIIGTCPDINGNGVLDVGSAFEQTISGTVTYEYGDDGLTSMPSATIDSNGYIYCVFSVYMETPDPTLANTAEVDVTDNLLDYRDLFVNYSTDGGKTWNVSKEQNITKTPYEEEVFPCLARRTTNAKLHLEYMADGWASSYVAGVSSGSTPANKQLNPDYNKIVYMGINISDVLAGNFGSPANYQSIMPIQRNILFSVNNVYPNPSNKENVNISITMNHPDMASVQIYDITGNMVVSQELGTLIKGTQIKSINTKTLPSGMYMVKVNAGGYTTVNKLVVE